MNKFFAALLAAGFVVSCAPKEEVTVEDVVAEVEETAEEAAEATEEMVEEAGEAMEDMAEEVEEAVTPEEETH